MNSKSYLIISLFLFFGLSCTSYAQTEKTFTVSNFSGIDASQAFNVQIKYGSSNSIKATGNENDLEDLKVEVRNGILTLNYQKSDNFNQRDQVNFEIYTSELKSLDLSGATNTTVDGFNNISRVNIDLSGASNLKFNSSAKSVDLDLSGASNLKLNGSYANLNAEISGASQMKASDGSIEIANIDASGASRAKLRVAKVLNVKASGASMVNYDGNPQVNEKSSGASSIKKM